LTKASFLKRMREQFPTLEKVAVPSSGGVAFRIVMAMKPRYAGEARAALLAAMTANMRPKIVIVVDPDIDVPPTPHWARAGRPHDKKGPAPSACSRRAT
jgi:2,5-furandicarboxylate decarboxylase 1